MPSSDRPQYPISRRKLRAIFQKFPAGRIVFRGKLFVTRVNRELELLVEVKWRERERETKKELERHGRLNASRCNKAEINSQLRFD